MIRDINMEAIAPVTAGVIERDIALAAGKNTPLAELMTRSYPMANSQVGKTDEETIKICCSAEFDEGQDGHSHVRDHIVEHTGKAIVKHATFARTVVLPILGKIFGEVRSSLEEDGPVPYTVEQVWLHDAITSPLVSQLIERYEGKPNTVAAAISDFPERDEETLSNLIATGSSSYDSLLVDLLSKVDIVSIYSKYFRGDVAVTVTTEGVPSIRFNPSSVLINEYLIVHLLAKALMDDPHKNSNRTLLEYRNELASYVESTGCAIFLTLKQWDEMRRRNVMIIQYPDKRPSAEKVVYVYGPVYQMFLQRDGDAEAVIGACVATHATMPPKYLADFVDNVAKLKVSYTNWLARQDNMRLSRSGEVIKATVMRELTLAINDLTDAENICNVSKSDMHRNALSMMHTVNEHEWIKDTYRYIRLVVCRVMFPESNAFRILSLIDEETQKRNEEDVRVAAYHAIKTLLVEHFLSQVVKL